MNSRTVRRQSGSSCSPLELLYVQFLDDPGQLSDLPEQDRDRELDRRRQQLLAGFAEGDVVRASRRRRGITAAEGGSSSTPSAVEMQQVVVAGQRRRLAAQTPPENAEKRPV